MNYDITLKYTPDFLRGYNRLELEQFLREAHHQLLRLREQSAMGGRVPVASKPHLFEKDKKDIARIKTILAEKGW